MGFCSKCGHKLNLGELFCPSCGSKTHKTKLSNKSLIFIVLGILIICSFAGYFIYSNIILTKQEAEDLALNSIKDAIRHRWDELINQGLKDNPSVTPSELANANNEINKFIDLSYVKESYKKDGVWFVVIASKLDNSVNFTVQIDSRRNVVLPKEITEWRGN